ncbi:MAG TPA: Uma2 family endonuclease [Bryobacteraceae bacterium]|jgi:Uma2 family endonuclease|nr:Uma2 family endonuclease [Bryobacteraceae bacterium]
MASEIITVDQFLRLPEDPEFLCELHHGELVTASRPKLLHIRVQDQLRKALDALLSDRYAVIIELPFRLSQFELRAADVAVLLSKRWARAAKNDVLHGAPEIVIEVLSRSNTVLDTAEYCALCLENGSSAFWTVDPRRRELRVSTPDGLTKTYKSGDSIPLAPLADAALAVDAVFAGIMREA